MKEETRAVNRGFLRVTFSCPENLLEALDKMCQRFGFQRSEAIRQAIREKLKREGVKMQGGTKLSKHALAVQKLKTYYEAKGFYCLYDDNNRLIPDLLLISKDGQIKWIEIDNVELTRKI